MKKIISVLLTGVLLAGCSSTSASATASSSIAPIGSDGPQNSTSTETVSNPDDIQCQALLFPFEDQGKDVVAVVMVSSDPDITAMPLSSMSESIKMSDGSLEDEIDDPMQYLTIDTTGKYVGYEMYTTDWQDTSALQDTLQNLEFDQYKKDDAQNKYVTTGEKIKVENVITVGGVTLQAAETSQREVLDFTLSDDGQRQYQLNGDYSFVKFTIPNDIDPSVYVAETGNTFAVYIPNSENSSEDQPVKAYRVAKGASASGTCCDTGWYTSKPDMEYSNGYRVSDVIASLGDSLTADKDVAIMEDLDSRSPLVTFTAE
jgi:hypothetical protein